MRTDPEIQQDVLAELKWRPYLNAAEIGVFVKNGVVTLTGQVDSYFKKLEAEHIAKKITGVKAVAEDIQVGVSPMNQRNDTEIAEAVVHALAWHTAVMEDKIKIKVEKGIVTLEGQVDWNFQRTAAANAIQYLIGVRGVSNFITVKPGITPNDVRQKIKASLQRHASVDADKITVEVTGGKVVLSGYVRSFAEMDDAQLAAWSAPGVTSVENRLTLEEREYAF